MIFGNLKKFLGFSKKEDPKNSEGSNNDISKTLRNKSEKFSIFLANSFDRVKDEIFSIREKCQNLRETNFDLGMLHLENGNIPEAIFRFRIIKKFWPDFYDAYFQLAYSLAVNDKVAEAKKVLEELLSKDPNYDPIAQELLDHLNKITSDAKNS